MFFFFFFFLNLIFFPAHTHTPIFPTWISKPTHTVESGYETYVAAFTAPEHALSFCADVQRTLHAIEWPPVFASADHNSVFAEVRDPVTGDVVLRGVRVAMGVHTGWGLATNGDAVKVGCSWGCLF
jgi:hypothetical protein